MPARNPGFVSVCCANALSTGKNYEQYQRIKHRRTNRETGSKTPCHERGPKQRLPNCANLRCSRCHQLHGICGFLRKNFRRNGTKPRRRYGARHGRRTCGIIGKSRRRRHRPRVYVPAYSRNRHRQCTAYLYQ